MSNIERNPAIIAAARTHISGTRSDGFEPAAADAYEWGATELPKVRGATQDEIRSRLAAEIERQLSISAAAAALGAIGGRARSEAKRAAARANGARGGAPRKS